MGYIHYENSSWAQARKELSAVVSDYPGTTAARLANDRLQRMQQEGH
jgi:TolA-binding protein